MSLHVEWFHTDSAVLTVEPRGTEIGEDEVTEQAALVLCGDECAVLEGPPSDLRELLRSALAELDRLAPPIVRVLDERIIPGRPHQD